MMIKPSKLMGLFIGASTAAAMGVAMAQSVPPHADVANPALGAGQQSVHNTPMGETGVSEAVDPTVLVVPMVMVEPAQPTAVVVVPEQPQSERTTMGAGPAEPQSMAQAPAEVQRSEPMVEPRQEPMPAQAPRADRN
jgi:hypothetical protein